MSRYYPFHPIVFHTFIDSESLLNLYRELRDDRTYQINGTQIACQARFPEHEFYFDLEGSMLGVVYPEILMLQNLDIEDLKEDERKVINTRFEKAINELYQILQVHKPDPNKGFYDRKCFEEHFGLTWGKPNDTNDA